MPRIELVTRIEAPRERAFDLARSIDLHAQGQARHRERAIAGVTSGPIGFGQSVTWEARHFGVTQRPLHGSSLSTGRDRFATQCSGPFARFDHEHIFEADDAATRMVDIFDFTSPLGLLGVLVDRLFVARYMERLVAELARSIKRAAESEAWKALLR